MTSLTLHPLLAAGDVWEIAIGAIFFILWTVGQLLGSRNEAKEKQKLPRPRPQQPQPVDMAEGLPQLRNQGPGNQGPGNQEPRTQEEHLRSEVEDFLRRAQGKPPKPQTRQPPEPVRQQQVPPRSRQPQRPIPAAPVARQAKAPATQTLRSEGVAEHVARHISTQEIAAHTQTLGAEVATADDKLESRLHKKFDHAMGNLEHRSTPPQSNQPTVNLAAEVAELLHSPAGMRQLIIANEILRRPEW